MGVQKSKFLSVSVIRGTVVLMLTLLLVICLAFSQQRSPILVHVDSGFLAAAGPTVRSASATATAPLGLGRPRLDRFPTENKC